THRELHSVARCAGSCPCWSSFPRAADSPGDSVLSPAARARVLVGHLSPGSRTHRGLHSVARCAGSCLCWSSFPRFADSPGATLCLSLAGLVSLLVIFPPGRGLTWGLRSVARCAGSCPCWSSFPRFADSPGATLCRPLRGLVSLLVIFPPVRGLTGGYTLSHAAGARVFVGYLSPGLRAHRGVHSVPRWRGS